MSACQLGKPCFDTRFGRWWPQIKKHRESVEMHMSHEMKADLLAALRIRYARRNREGKGRMQFSMDEQGFAASPNPQPQFISDVWPKPMGGIRGIAGRIDGAQAGRGTSRDRAQAQ